MYFIAKTPMGQFQSVYSDDQEQNYMLKQKLSESLSDMDYLYFDCEAEGGVTRISLGPDVIKNSVFIIVE